MLPARDAYNPFQPAVSYLVSGGRRNAAGAHHRATSSLASLGSDVEFSMTSRMPHGASAAQIPLINLSRTPSPYPPTSASNPGSETEDDLLDDTSVRRPFLPHHDYAKGWRGMLFHGGLGHWLFATPRGWQTYVGFLVLWMLGCGIGLSLMNRIILLTGVYKFPYPLTTTLFELLIAHALLLGSASLTRGLSTHITNAGLSGAIAPSQPLQTSLSNTPQTKPTSAVGRVLSVLGGGSGGIAGGGLFEFDIRVARMVLPVSAVFVGKVVLSNLSFAYAQLPIYISARIAIVPFALLLEGLFGGSALSVPLMSAALTATLNLFVASMRTNIRVTWESIVAGVFSSFFVALFPVLLQRAYKNLLADVNSQSDALNYNAIYGGGSSAADASGSKQESRATWRLLHYASLLSILLLIPMVLLSGEVANISRNCYFLDVFFHWFMITCGGIGSWAVFLGTLMAVKATSPLTTTFLFIPRAAFMLPVLSKFKMPSYCWIGIAICWASCFWFVRIRRKEGKALQRMRTGF